MKQVLFFEILRMLKAKPAVKYVAASANQIVTSPITQNQIQSVKAEFQKIQFQPMTCWGNAQSLLAVQPWLEKPALENLRALKVSCFG